MALLNHFVCLLIFATILSAVCSLNCIQCKQSETPECLDAINMKATPCTPNSNLACYSRLDGNLVERGCLSNLTATIQNTCKDTNSSECEVCDDSEGCNRQIFPKNRINCYQCQDRDCNVPTITAKPCKKFMEFEQCVTVFTKYAVKMRACRSDLEEATIEKCNNKNDFTCKSCLANKCNNDTIRDDDACVQCFQSEEDSNYQCVDPGKPENFMFKKCNVTSEGRCYNRLDKNGFIDRGCLSNLPTEEQKSCNDTSKADCQICTGGKECNYKVFPENRLSCKQSRYSDNLKYCPLHMNNIDEKCVSIFGDDFELSQRDCFSSLSNTHKDLCLKEELRCIPCEGHGCNKHNNRKDDVCIVCDQYNNTNCHFNNTTSKLCPDDNRGKCFSRLDNWGRTFKGCSKDLNEGCSSDKCKICTNGNDCNKEMYPPDRLSCYQCDSSIDKNCTEAQNNNMRKAKLCALWMPDRSNGCYTKITIGGVVIRGCTSDGLLVHPCNNGSNLDCYDCYSNACNDKNSAIKTIISLSNTVIPLFIYLIIWNQQKF